MDKVFVYGTLKKGFGLHRVVAKSRFLGKSTLSGYAMFSRIYFPYITKGEGKIHGEVYEVNQDTLQLLDAIESGYKRERVVVNLKGEKIKVYVYVFESEVGGKKIDSGVWT